MMHRLWRDLATLAAVAFLTTGAAKADGDPKSFAAPAAPFSWTGYYVGAQVGGLANLAEITDPLGPSLFGNPNLATGAFGGVQAGYSTQSGVLVYGVEADIVFPQIEGTSTCSALSGTFINSSCKVGIDAFGTLTARLGLALGPDGRSLLYGKGGIAWATGSLDLVTNDSEHGHMDNPYVQRSDDLSPWGWTLGAGAEYALPGNWSVKAEYDYANFANQSVALLQSASIDAASNVIDPVPVRQGHISSELHSFKLGLYYRFGRAAGPLDAPEPVSLKDSSAPSLHQFGFEVGGRYWYSWGRHKYDLGGGRTEPYPAYSVISRITYDDIDASTGEVTGRLTAPWNIFAKGFLGGGTLTGGRMNDEDFNIESRVELSPGIPRNVAYTNTISPKVEGDIPSYGTIDIGYDWWRAPSYRVGTYAGYNYYSEEMAAYGFGQTANPDGSYGPNVRPVLAPIGHAIISQQATWQSLRLGATAEFNLAPRLRLSGDAAFLPYVSVDAEDRHYNSNTPMIGSINPLSGHGVGTQLEAMLLFDVTDRLSLGVGARYWAMWTTNANFVRTYDALEPVTYPLHPQNLKIETERAGVLGSVTYRFD